MGGFATVSLPSVLGTERAKARGAMGPHDTASTVYLVHSPSRVEDLELNVEARELRRAREVIHAEPKVFDLLTLLVSRSPRVVTREELLRNVWPGENVCSGAIAQCVCQARRLLGDSSSMQQYIKTVPRRGYRFVAPVAVSRSEQPTSAAAS